MRSMTSAPLSRLIVKFPILARDGDGDPVITDICYDSRRVVPDSLFVAIPGEHVDGHTYIDAAVAEGAVAVICERLPEQRSGDVVYLQVPKSRLALSAISARFFDHPSRRLPVIGVTGTDGKARPPT
mgnify:FL=1